MNKKKGIILSVLCILSLILITAGVTYAFFNYAKEGLTENSVTTGTIEFLYTEVDKVGAGISINDALPISDEIGKAQTGAGKVFNFKVTSKVAGNYDIPYTITARKKMVNNLLDEEAVRIYLTEEVGSIEKEILLDNYSNLEDYANTPENMVEKVLYEGLVPTGSTNYEKVFKLRMWLDESIDFSPVKDEEGNDIYPYNDKEFTVTVNVYANAKVVTDSDIDMANTTGIKEVLVNDNIATSVENEEYDYYQELAIEEKEANIGVETTNPESEVEVTKLDGSIAYKNTGIRRLSTIQKITLPLEEGDNLFNIKIISANKQVENEYILKVTTKDKTSPTVSGSLSGKIVSITYSDNVGITEYIVSTSTSAPSSGWTSIDSSTEGTIEYTLPNIGTYYIYVKDKEGNITKSENSFTPESSLYYPKVSASLSGKVITITYSDDIGVSSYIVSTSTTAPSDGWTSITSNNKSGSVQYTTTSSQTYYVYVKNTLGYITKATGIFTPASNLFCAYTEGQVVKTFSYKGSPELFTVPCNGTYKLEVWGAQGGAGSQVSGGKGGYANGEIYLVSGKILNVVIGGAGTGPVSGTVSGGYNGGGGIINNEDGVVGTGGGATHIALNNGSYSTLYSYGNINIAKNYVYIVAGGGGGSQASIIGGTGGGTNGGKNSYGSGTAGTQTSGYAFGQGDSLSGGGSGGGWYGGINIAGGSGYIGGVTDGSMSNGVQSGNGKAQITLVSLN